MEEMAAHLHELDPNHIVAMGTEGMELLSLGFESPCLILGFREGGS